MPDLRICRDPAAQEKSVRPGINDPFQNPDVKKYVETFEAAEQPTKGSKVVFDVSAVAKETGKPVPGLERAAVLLNLGGAATNMIGKRLKANNARWCEANVNRTGVVCSAMYSGHWAAFWLAT